MPPEMEVLGAVTRTLNRSHPSTNWLSLLFGQTRLDCRSDGPFDHISSREPFDLCSCAAHLELLDGKLCALCAQQVSLDAFMNDLET